MIEIKDYALPSPDQWRMVIKGMRNAFKSWDKSDSFIEEIEAEIISPEYYDLYHEKIPWSELNDENLKWISKVECETAFFLGNADKNLLINLSKLGSSDRKVLRQLPITLDIKAPLYWWKQMDQYKIGTATNSESTMHTITKRDLKLEDFSINDREKWEKTELKFSLNYDGFAEEKIFDPIDYLEETITTLNDLRHLYLNLHDPTYWNKIIEFLPESYNQTRTWTGSYENIINIILQRYYHKLPEWEVFCKWCLDNIPLVKEIIELLNPEIFKYYGDKINQ